MEQNEAFEFSIGLSIGEVIGDLDKFHWGSSPIRRALGL